TAEVTGITLSGANASQYSLSGANECIGEFGSGNNCQFEVNFTPGSTGQKTALVTITSDAGVSQTNLAGTGQDKTQNSLTVKPRNASARKGKVIQLRVRAANTGGTASKSTNVCVRLNQRALRLGGNRCRTIGSLPAGASRNITFRVRVTWRARTGVRYPVSIRMNSGNAIVRKVVANLRRKR
ncbi:MAG: Choice-of-anchor protein, partial [Actinomycetota bacterium]|nr:Choice-of-anchor protein [Actinomycetota bacterium]